MKRTFISAIIIFIGISSFACPICGCGVGNFYMGLLPEFESKFIGIRYQYLKYHTEITGSEDEFSTDYFNTVEIWGGISVGSKWQILGFIPYQVNKQIMDDGVIRTSGLGDISLVANYKLFDKMTMKQGNHSNAQELWIGGGVKLPTGKFHIESDPTDLEVSEVNAQAGTGSVDFLLTAAYNLRLHRFGINTSANYKINTANSDHYLFGNRFNASTTGYYQTRLHNVSIAPNVGLLYQHAAINQHNKETVEETGGYLAMASGGAEINYKKITFGASLLLPVSQNFAHGQTEAKLRSIAHVSFSF